MSLKKLNEIHRKHHYKGPSLKQWINVMAEGRGMMEIREDELKQIILNAYQEGFKVACDCLNEVYESPVTHWMYLPDPPEVEE